MDRDLRKQAAVFRYLEQLSIIIVVNTTGLIMGGQSTQSLPSGASVALQRNLSLYHVQLELVKIAKSFLQST